MSKTIEMLKNYKPYNEQEKDDLKLIIDAEKIFGDILTRDNLFCHLTSSAFVVNKDRTKCLFLYHNIFDSWTWPGGHADGDDDMIYVAKKEIGEETSIKNIKLLNNGNPITIDTLPVLSHYRKSKYVPAHTHLSIAYLFEADEKDKTHIQEDENKAVRWFTFEEMLKLKIDKFMLPVFKKCIDKIKTFNL